MPSDFDFALPFFPIDSYGRPRPKYNGDYEKVQVEFVERFSFFNCLKRKTEQKCVDFCNAQLLRPYSDRLI